MRKPIFTLSPIISTLVFALVSIGLVFPMVSNAAQGDSASAVGTFTDRVTGIEMSMDFFAEENFGTDYGRTKYYLSGQYMPNMWAIRSCSTHGAPGQYYDGFAPLKEILCGRNSRMRVSIHHCRVSIETHAYTHADVPFVMFSGQTTTDIKLKKSKNRWHASVNIYTPKAEIKLHGPFTGSISVSSCNE